MSYDWDFQRILTIENVHLLLSGFEVTLLLTLTSIVFATPLGALLGYLGVVGDKRCSLWSDPLLNPSKRLALFYKLTRLTTNTFVNVIRSIPLLIFILVVFYGLPPLFAVTWNRLPGWQGWSPGAFTCACTALTINLSAFVADFFRSAFRTFPESQAQAAQALAVAPSLFFRKVVLPDVCASLLAPLVNLYITIFKMSTLASVVSVYEILHSGDLIIQRTYRPLEVYSVIAVIFIVFNAVFVQIEHALERKMLTRGKK